MSAGVRCIACEQRSGCRHLGFALELCLGGGVAVVGDDTPHTGLTEDEARALVRIVHVHRNVRRTHGEHGEDGDVQLLRAGRDAHADPVAPPYAGVVKLRGGAPDTGHQIPVAECP